MSDGLRLDWTGEMSFTAATESGHALQLDATTANGGRNAAPQPLELLLVSLAGCAAMDVLAILTKKRQPIEGFSLLVRYERAGEHPRVYTEIHIEYIVQGTNVQRAAIERAIELTEAKYCPVHAMLAPAVHLTHSYRVVDRDGQDAP